MKLFYIGLLGFCLFSNYVSAHDFWIKPTTFSPSIGENVGIHLLVGQHFEGEIVPRMSNWMDRFEYVHVKSSEVKPVSGKEWNDPAGEVKLTKPGLYAIGFQSFHQSVVIDPVTFALYLREEGLDSILKLRDSRGESQSKGNEVFLRCCKALINSEGDYQEGFDYEFGLKLELIPKKNPLTLPVNEELPIQLLFMGKPVQGVLVVALEHENPMKRITARTDQNGLVGLKLPSKGHWLIKAVHMTEVDDENIYADWQSFWASLVFNITQ